MLNVLKLAVGIPVAAGVLLAALAACVVVAVAVVFLMAFVFGLAAWLFWNEIGQPVLGGSDVSFMQAWVATVIFLVVTGALGGRR